MYTDQTHILLYAFSLPAFARAIWNGQPVKIIVVIRWVKIKEQSEVVVISEIISSSFFIIENNATNNKEHVSLYLSPNIINNESCSKRKGIQKGLRRDPR